MSPTADSTVYTPPDHPMRFHYPPSQGKGPPTALSEHSRSDSTDRNTVYAPRDNQSIGTASRASGEAGSDIPLRAERSPSPFARDSGAWILGNADNKLLGDEESISGVYFPTAESQQHSMPAASDVRTAVNTRHRAFLPGTISSSSGLGLETETQNGFSHHSWEDPGLLSNGNHNNNSNVAVNGIDINGHVERKSLNSFNDEDGGGSPRSRNSGGMTHGESMTKIFPTTSESITASESSRRASRKPAPKHISQQFFQVEPCLYTHRIFLRAAKIFAALKNNDLETEHSKANRRRLGIVEVPKEKIPEMEFRDAQEQIKTFELTFATLKYQQLFFDTFEKIGFFRENAGLKEDYSLVCIILNDLQSRKFQRRTPFPGEDLDDVCLEIEEALLRRKTKFLSHIAKERIKNNAPSIEFLLPEQVRDKDETKSKTPVYLWVNQLRTTMEEMKDVLNEDGFQEVGPEVDMSSESDKVFSVDPHCTDLLAFPPQFSLFFKESEWVKSARLVQQDKSSCLAPQSVQYLLGQGHDILHVNIGTAMTTGHLASLLRNKSTSSHILGYLGTTDSERMRKACRNLDFLGATKNVKALPDDFLSTDPEDSKFKSVRVILITANCSKSAITSPVQFIVSEGEDMQILSELSKAESDATHIGNLMMEHEKLLKHALKFPKLQAVVYSTRSRHEAENESVVTKVLEYVNRGSTAKKPAFRLSPPVLPFSGDEINPRSASGVVGSFVKFLPSDKSNGCFVATIIREPEDPKEAARNAIAKAKSKGVLGKTRSAPAAGAESNEDAAFANGQASDIEDGVRPKAEGLKSKLVKSASHPSPGAKAAKGQSSKISHRKTAVAIGARLYQAGLLNKMEQVGKPKSVKSEHVKVVKHPAPFR